jgi:hypothetical protein
LRHVGGERRKLTWGASESKGESRPCEADLRSGTGVSVGLKRGRDEDRVRGFVCGTGAEEIWEKRYEGGAEVEVGSSAGFILDVGLAKP